MFEIREHRLECARHPGSPQNLAAGARRTAVHKLYGAEEEIAMCDYSLHFVASRPAKVGDRLVSTRFPNSITRGFAAVGEPDIAVCLLPGTELAFENEVEYDPALGSFLLNRKVRQKVARLRKVNNTQRQVHHDALEFPDGQIVLLTRLCEGQRATVLQLPAVPAKHPGRGRATYSPSNDRVISS